VGTPDHGLFCNCAHCKLEWARQDAYDAAHPLEGGDETINYENEKDRDRDLGFPQGAEK
jgi:hypothetical protein